MDSSNPDIIQYTVRSRQKRLGLLIKYAECMQYLENPLYALMDTILSSLTDTLSWTADPSSLFSYPQHRLVNHNTAMAGSTRDIQDATPDFSITHVEWLEDSPPMEDPMKQTAVLIFEIKRLYETKTKQSVTGSGGDENGVSRPEGSDKVDALGTKGNSAPKPGSGPEKPAEPVRRPKLDWSNKLDVLAHSSNTFYLHLHQLLAQASCAFNSFNQNTLNLVFVCGIYFTLVEFKRPPPQQSGEAPATENSIASSPPAKIDPIALAQSFFADAAITPKIHIFNCPIFDLNDPEYPSFSPPWLLALKLALNPYRANINIIKNNLFPFPATSQLDDGDGIVERTNWANSQLMEWYNALPLGFRCSTPDGDRLDFFESPLRHERTGEILPEVQESPGYQSPPAPLSGITTERVLLKRRRLKRGRSSDTER